MKLLPTIEWVPTNPASIIPGKVRFIDQTLLPLQIEYIETDSSVVIWKAIKNLQVRGAPAMGIAAAMGVAAALQFLDANDSEQIAKEVKNIADYLATSRPTAVNLFWALDRMRNIADRNKLSAPDTLKKILVEEAVKIHREDVAMCRAIGEHGVTLLHDNISVLTHCNAGSLATSIYGTALAPIYVAHERGMKIKVFADETRPLLQGARLTAWELTRVGIPVTLICDSVAAQVMREGRVDMVMVGADRIASNGDTANKIGTYGLAVLAKAHGIPFYVLAPGSTLDRSLPNGTFIPIEERDASEVTEGFGKRTGPEGVSVYSPAFDVTPHNLITAIITERGVHRPPFVFSD